MFSKTTKNKTGNRGTLIYRIFWSSIIGRLTFLYALSAFGMLVLSTVFLYRVLGNNLESDNNIVLADEIRVLRLILHERPNSQEALEEEVKFEGAASPYFIRILDEGGQILMETPHMADIIAASLFPDPIGVRQEPRRGVKWRSHNGRLYILMSAWAEVGHPSRKQRLLQVAMDVSQDDALIANYRRKLLIVLLLGVLFSATAGVMVARQGMRPLEEITKVAQRITATQLHERISPARWPKELTALAIAFDEMLNRLENSFNQLSQFSADLAHELRTPINNLMGEAEVALSRTRTLDEYRHILESSLEECGRLSRMIDSLLFLARAESRDTQIKRSPLNAFKEIKAVQEFHESVAEEQGVEVTCQGNALLNADPILFRRVVSNLLSNALQYTTRGGKVIISIKQTDNECVEVSVSDTGSGIAPEHLPRIFDRFYRADPARSQYPQGAGLGLAIVKSIMDLHGGTVAIESNLNKGTTVTLRFPYTSDEQAGGGSLEPK